MNHIGRFGQSGDRKIYNPEKKIYVPTPPPPSPSVPVAPETPASATPPDILKQFNEMLGAMITVGKETLRQRYGAEAIQAIDILMLAELKTDVGLFVCSRTDIESTVNEDEQVRKTVNMCARYIGGCSS